MAGNQKNEHFSFCSFSVALALLVFARERKKGDFTTPNSTLLLVSAQRQYSRCVSALSSTLCERWHDGGDAGGEKERETEREGATLDVLSRSERRRPVERAITLLFAPLNSVSLVQAHLTHSLSHSNNSKQKDDSVWSDVCSQARRQGRHGRRGQVRGEFFLFLTKTRKKKLSTLMQTELTLGTRPFLP